MAEARAHQDRLTKPRGSLGALEDVAVRLAGIAALSPPPLPEPAALAIFAADHGVHAQGVSPWPQEVTTQMVANFLAGGAVANAFAAQAGISVTVVDVGVATDLPPAPNLLILKTGYGTADLSQGPAMTEDQALTALHSGIETATTLIANGARCLVTGDMGIANTTASAALICAFTGRDPAEVTGRGTGIDDATLHHKIAVIRQALTKNTILETPPTSGDSPQSPPAEPKTPAPTPQPETTALPPADVAAAAVPHAASVLGNDESVLSHVRAETGALPHSGADTAGAPDTRGEITVMTGDQARALRILAAVGGFEHAAIAGFVLGAAAQRIPVVLDGVIAGAAALVAAALAPEAVGYCVAGHRSAEPGHTAALEFLGLRPLVDLELRLGEGTGGLLAHPLVVAAARVMHDVATFDSAGVSDKT
nr:nicotinate-nucleotide--dimethylbenzimidazole phosphoribosyltransferase [Acrocarpospora pleiomorpha]